VINHVQIPVMQHVVLQDITNHGHTRRISNPLPEAKTYSVRQTATCPEGSIPNAVHITSDHHTHPATLFASPSTIIEDIEPHASLQPHDCSVSPLSPEDSRRESGSLRSPWSYRKPVPKRTSSPVSVNGQENLKDHDSTKALDSLGDRNSLENHTIDNSTADLRFSTLRPLTRQLDDVKEEPNLEHSCVDLKSSTFRFPLPQRKSSLVHYESHRLSKDMKMESSWRHSSRHLGLHPKPSTPDQRTSRDVTFRPPSGAMTLIDMRTIPSLNFSRQDLFSKLNDALDLRRTTSCDQFPQLVAPPPSRPFSSHLMREKYRSFFQTLDGMTNDITPNIQTNKEHQLSTAANEKPSKRESLLLSSSLRPLSTDELIAELERISMPSLNGLTQRLSELLPSLKRYYGETGEVIYEEDTVRSAIEEIRKLGELAGIAGECDLSTAENNPFDMSVGVEGFSHSPDNSLSESTSNLQTRRPRSASSPGMQVEAPVPPLAELEAPCSAVLRSRSLSDGVNPSFIGGYSGLSNLARISERSLRGSPASRPWNVDANYPWADSAPCIDISLPAPTLRRDVITQKPSRLRLRISRGSGSTDELGAELSSVAIPGDPSDSTGITTDTFRPNHKRKTSKRSILGSLSRKIGLGNSFDQGGFANSRQILGEDDRVVDPGDRYPTTGLSPPSALNIDEVRSFFSDDSSAHGHAAIHGVSFRKRLTNLRTRLPPIVRAQSALEHRCPPHGSEQLRRSNSLFVSTIGTNSTIAGSAVAYADGVLGMPKTEFRAKKLVDRMKTLWYKGGELLRSLSGKKKNEGRRPHDWEDSGESGIWSNV
jgi:serine/arginine repetitive matrix protein 2